VPVQGEGKAASLLGAETRHTALIATFSAALPPRDLGQNRLVHPSEAGPSGRSDGCLRGHARAS
jgi:hypothetical protein